MAVRSLMGIFLLSIAVMAGAQSPSELSLDEVLEKLRTRNVKDSVEARAVGERGLALLKTAPDEAAEAKIRLEMGRAYLSDRMIDEGRVELKKALELGEKAKLPVVVSGAHNGLGVSYRWQSESAKAELHFRAALKIAREAGDTKTTMHALNNVALTLKRQADYLGAVQLFSESMKLAEKSGDDGMRATLLNNIGNAYSANMQADRALTFLTEARELKEKIDDPTLYMTLTNIGICLGRLGRDKEALGYYSRAEKGALAAADEVQAVIARLNAGVSYLREEEYEKARDLLEKAATRLRTMKARRELSVCLVALGMTYDQLDMVQDAERVLKEGREVALGAGAPDAPSLLALAETHASLGSYEEAYKNAREYAYAKHRQGQEKSKRAYVEFQAEFEAEKQKRQIAELERDNKAAAMDLERERSEREMAALELDREQSRRRGMTIGILFSIAMVFALWRMYVGRLRANQELATTNGELARHRDELQKALDEVKTLRGMLPVCSSCGDVRDDDGDWLRMDRFIEQRTTAQVSHGICPPCTEKIYGKEAAELVRREMSAED